MTHKLLGILAFAGLSIAGSMAVHAQATPSVNAGALSFQNATGMYNGTLTISGPNGFHAESFSEGGLPKFVAQSAGKLEDGLYSYTLTAATRERVKLNASANNGRGEANRDAAAKPYSTSGTFNVVNGRIVKKASANKAGGSDTDQVE